MKTLKEPKKVNLSSDDKSRHSKRNTEKINEVHSNLNSVKKNSTDEIISLSEVFNYVSTKYGTARTQLKNLSEKGCYDTVVFDCSGIGSGPNIKYPVESLVCLPTPTHQIPGLHLQTKKASNDTATSERTCTSRSVYRISKDMLTYASAQGINFLPATPGDLFFESRFESGNLSQAYKV